MIEGQVHLEDGLWHVEGPPYVLTRLKRVFGKADARDMGVVKLADTAETCRDLEWFLTRFPLRVRDEEALRAGAERHRQRAERVRHILSPDFRPPRAAEIVKPLRSYQAVVPPLVAAQGFLLLADDLGTGKTAAAAGVLALAGATPAVYATKAHLTDQVAEMLAEFVPSLRVHVVKKGTPYPLPEFLGRPPDVLVMSWAKVAGWAEELAGKIRTVVYDEVHELRRSDSLRYSGANHLAAGAEYRLGMSATPVHNRGIEAFNIINVLAPGILGTRAEFSREWCGYYDESVADPEAFGRYLRDEGIMLRRTRSDVGREIPPVTRVPHKIPADTAALDAVESSATELARIILSQGRLEKGARMHAAERLTSVLRQATGVAKAPHVADFVRMLLEDSEESIILAGWHKAVYDVWRERLAAFEPAFYTGDESVGQKRAAADAFRRRETRLLIMSLRSGEGLNGLQMVCSTTVHGELDWSPEVHNQLNGRVARDGQTSPVFSYFPVSDVGTDPTMSELLGLKRAEVDRIRDPGQDLVEVLGSSSDRVNRLAESYLRSRGLAA